MMHRDVLEEVGSDMKYVFNGLNTRKVKKILIEDISDNCKCL